MGSLIVVTAAYVACLAFAIKGAHVGLTGATALIVMAVASIALAQLLWIWGAGGLGILFASLHMQYCTILRHGYRGCLQEMELEPIFGAANIGIAVLTAQARQFTEVSTDINQA